MSLVGHQILAGMSNELMNVSLRRKNAVGTYDKIPPIRRAIARATASMPATSAADVTNRSDSVKKRAREPYASRNATNGER